MTQDIIQNGAYAERITVTPIPALNGQFHVQLESQCKGAKDPEAWRTVYRITCTQWGLENIGKEIYEAIQASNVRHPSGT